MSEAAREFIQLRCIEILNNDEEHNRLSGEIVKLET